METIEHRIPNGDGWSLSLFQTWDEARFVPGRRPVLIVPGYGMNSFIFSYHPRGISLEGYLAHAGFEVWRVDLRSQGRSAPLRSKSGRRDDFRLEDLADTDLGAAIDAALARSRTGASKADVLGASLGGTMMFIHAVLRPNHRMGSLVALGSPVRWVKVHPAVRVAFASPTLVGLVRLRGTRKLVEKMLPLLVKRSPWLLSVYMNPELTDTSAASEMVKTVEDPNRYINRQIATWIQKKDLVIRGRNVSEGLAAITAPLLCVLANRDGIVPPETARFCYERVGSASRALLEVGTGLVRMSHADMFISNEAHERVFRPLVAWLLEHQELPARAAG